MIADMAGVMVRKSRVLGVNAWRGCGTGLEEDRSFVEWTDSRWVLKVTL